MIPEDVWIPDRELYRPRFSPWFGGGELGELLAKIQPFTLVSEASCHALYTLALQSVRLGGVLWKCGVARAIDDFFRDRPEEPFVSPTAQAIVWKLGNAPACPG